MTEHADPQAADRTGQPGGDTPPGAPGQAPQAQSATDVGSASPADSGLGPDPEPLDVEHLVITLEAVTAERDSHLSDLQRMTAEFANFRRQATKRQTDTVAHAASGLVDKLVPILDACEAAILHGATDVVPIHTALVESLRKEGLEVMAEPGVVFDPERHEAVAHEPGDGGEPTVAEVLRSGYVWNGRILRPAMVRVHG